MICILLFNEHSSCRAPSILYFPNLWGKHFEATFFICFLWYIYRTSFLLNKFDKEKESKKSAKVLQFMSLMTIWEHGFGSIQVDLGGMETDWSAIVKRVSISGFLTKKTMGWEKSSAWSMIPGTYLSFLRTSSSRN